MQQLPATFEDHAIRRVYDEATETWWFSVVDIVQVLTQQPDYKAARNYWKELKNRLAKEGCQVVTNCNRLKLTAADGKNCVIDVAMPQTLLRQVHLATDAHRWTQIKTCRPSLSLSPFIAVHRWLPSFFRFVMKSQSEEFFAGKAKILFNRDEGDEGDKSRRVTLVSFSSPSSLLSLLSLFKTSFLPAAMEHFEKSFPRFYRCPLVFIGGWLLLGKHEIRVQLSGISGWLKDYAALDELKQSLLHRAFNGDL